MGTRLLVCMGVVGGCASPVVCLCLRVCMCVRACSVRPARCVAGPHHPFTCAQLIVCGCACARAAAALQGVPPGLTIPPAPSAGAVAFATSVLTSSLALVTGIALAAKRVRSQSLELAADFGTGARSCVCMCERAQLRARLHLWACLCALKWSSMSCAGAFASVCTYVRIGAHEQRCGVGPGSCPGLFGRQHI